MPGRNAVVLDTGDPGELLSWLERLRARPGEARSIRRAGQSTARLFAWPAVVECGLLPRIELAMSAPADVASLIPRVHAAETRAHEPSSNPP